MAQIVCISDGTLKKDINELDDIVSIHDDDVALTGTGYESFRIIEIDMPIKDFQEKLNSLVPEVKEALRISSTDGWTLEEPERKPVWKNSDGEWCDLIEQPKYALSCKNLTAENITELQKDSVAVTTVVKESILSNSIVDKISDNSKNLIKVDDLNK